MKTIFVCSLLFLFAWVALSYHGEMKNAESMGRLEAKVFILETQMKHLK